MISDITGDYLKSALSGLQMQRQALVDNVSNMETPGYLAKRVDFETSLRQAIQDGSAPTSSVTNSTSLAPTGLNGNNVQVDDELMSLTDNSLRHQLVVESLNSRYRILRTAIGN